MRRLILTLLAGTLLAVSGCCVMPDGFRDYRPFSSLADCWRTTVRRPADWCWGDCPETKQTDDGLRVDGVDPAGN